MAMLTDRTHRNNYYHTADKHTADMSGVTSYRGQTADSRQASFSANCKREIVPPRLEPRRPQVVGRGPPLAALACACVFLLIVRERERLVHRELGWLVTQRRQRVEDVSDRGRYLLRLLYSPLAGKPAFEQPGSRTVVTLTPCARTGGRTRTVGRGLGPRAPCDGSPAAGSCCGRSEE